MKCPRCNTPTIMNGQRWCHVCGAEIKQSKFKEIALTLLKCLCCYMAFYVISDVAQELYVLYCAALTRYNGLKVIDGGSYSEGFWTIFSKGYAWVMILTYAVIFLAFVLWFVLRKREPLEEMGINRFDYSHIPGFAVLGASFQTVISITVAIVSVFTGPIGEQTQQSYDNMFGDETTLSMFIFMAVATPIIEETVFRGLIHGSLRGVMPRGAAMVISSVFFGLCHGELYRVIYATLLGLILAVFYEKYNSIVPCIIIHTAFNSMSFVYEVLPQNTLVYISIYFIAMGAAIASATFFFVPICPTERKSTNETL